MGTRNGNSGYTVDHLGALLVLGAHLLAALFVVLGTLLERGTWYDDADLFELAVGISPFVVAGAGLVAITSIRQRRPIPAIGSGILISLVGIGYRSVEQIGPVHAGDTSYPYLLDPTGTILTAVTVIGGLSITVAGVVRPGESGPPIELRSLSRVTSVPLFVVVLAILLGLFVPVYHVAAVAWGLLTSWATIVLLFAFQLVHAWADDSPRPGLYAVEVLGAAVLFFGVLMGSGLCVDVGLPPPSTFEVHATYSLDGHTLSFRRCSLDLLPGFVLAGFAILLAAPIVDRVLQR